jgi:hypothetical protein
MHELASTAIRVASSVIQCVSPCDIERRNVVYWNTNGRSSMISCIQAYQASGNGRCSAAMSTGRLLGTIMLSGEDRTLESVYKQACTLSEEQRDHRCVWQVECNYDGYTHHDDMMGPMEFKVRVIQPNTEHALPPKKIALGGEAP